MVANKKSSKSIYIKTFGCSLNQSDSETMAGLLRDSGFDVVCEYGSVEKNYPITQFDVAIINSCTVKNLSESKFFRELRRWQSRGATVIAAGCVPQAESGLLDGRLKDVSVIGTRHIADIVDVVNDTISGKIVHAISNDYNGRLNLPKIRKVGMVEIIPISEGCTSNCSYCKTKFARGELLSYPKEQIIAQFKSALDDGCKEFWITSQDNGCYGIDIYRKEKYFLPQLLNDLLSMKGDFRIRLGMCNPDHVDRIKDDLVRTFKNPKIFKFLHIPVQSGNDKVLREMKRPYTVKKFLRIISLFREEIPDVTMSTDIIVGFPDESEKEFKDTLKLVSGVKFEVLNYSRFWSRKGTSASQRKQLPSEIMVERSGRLKECFEGYLAQTNECWVGKKFDVLIDEVSRDGSFIGRNDSYKQVRLESSGNDSHRLKLGDSVKVRIVDARKYVLIGERI